MLLRQQISYHENLTELSVLREESSELLKKTFVQPLTGRKTPESHLKGRKNPESHLSSIGTIQKFLLVISFLTQNFY